MEDKKYCIYPECYNQTSKDKTYCIDHKNSVIIKTRKVEIWLGDRFVATAEKDKDDKIELDINQKLTSSELIYIAGMLKNRIVEEFDDNYGEQ